MKHLIELIASVINISPTVLNLQSGPGNISNWDSLAHVGVAAAVEQTYQVQLEMSEILSIKTIADIRNLLEKRGVTFVNEEHAA
jgi:acyl carrier protein